MSLELASTTSLAPTLSDLASTANDEHRRAVGAVTSAVEHAIRAGEALIAARRQVERTQWGKWCKDNVDITGATIFRYIRLATYADQLPQEPLGIDAAYELLRGLPHLATVYGTYNKKTIPVDVEEEIHRLRSDGLAWKAIAEAVGLNYQLVLYRFDPSYAKKAREATSRYSKRRAAERQALARQERDEAVRKIGGKAANAYALIRRAAVELDRSLASAEPHERGPLLDALAYTHKAEDEIVKALRVGRAVGRPHAPREKKTDLRSVREARGRRSPEEIRTGAST